MEELEESLGEGLEETEEIAEGIAKPLSLGVYLHAQDKALSNFMADRNAGMTDAFADASLTLAPDISTEDETEE